MESSAGTIRSDSVFASRRRMILAVALQAVIGIFAVSTVFSLASGPAAYWILVWCVLDLFVGAAASPTKSIDLARAPLLTAVGVTATVAILATFTSAGDIAPTVIVDEGDRIVFIVGLWGAAVGTAFIRVLVPVLLPKRRLRIVSAAHGGVERGTIEMVLGSRARIDSDTFVSAILTEVVRRDIELVELTFSVDAETLRGLSWAMRRRDVELYLPIIGLGLDPARMRALSATDGSGLLIAPSRPGLFSRGTKRIFDVGLALLLVIVFSPVLLAVALAIKISMPGPVFFTQTRVGLDGRPFSIVKFRSMIVDADSQLKQLLQSQGAGTQPLFKVDSDPRITRLGQLLRRSSLDELPQLFNVIGGSMSLVGPRPQRDGEVALYRGSDHHRLGVRPGMTGLWQVSGRSDLGWEQAREFDLYYAHNWNLKNDLKILLRTFGAVVRAAGAR
jgi:lipopolysaccharide/colanic/teichoic acid biosynthesis glycosyltransferase